LLLPLAMLAIVPARLLSLQLRLSPSSTLESAALYVALIAVLYWIRQTLSHLPIHGAGASAPALHRSPPAALGAGIPLLLAIVIPVYMGGPSGDRAIAEAQRKVGPGYSFSVQQLTRSGRNGRAVVVAYSDREIRHVAVDWQEP
jgi:hypothetical protein